MWTVVKNIWIGFEPGIDGVAIVINRGEETESRFAMGRYIATDAGCSLTRHGVMLIADSNMTNAPMPPQERRYDA